MRRLAATVLSVVAVTAPATAAPTRVALPGPGLAIDGDDGRLVVLLGRGNGCPRLLLGDWTGALRRVTKPAGALCRSTGLVPRVALGAQRAAYVLESDRPDGSSTERVVAADLTAGRERRLALVTSDDSAVAEISGLAGDGRSLVWSYVIHRCARTDADPECETTPATHESAVRRTPGITLAESADAGGVELLDAIDGRSLLRTDAGLAVVDPTGAVVSRPAAASAPGSLSAASLSGDYTAVVSPLGAISLLQRYAIATGETAGSIPIPGQTTVLRSSRSLVVVLIGRRLEAIRLADGRRATIATISSGSRFVDAVVTDAGVAWLVRRGGRSFLRILPTGDLATLLS